MAVRLDVPSLNNDETGALASNDSEGLVHIDGLDGSGLFAWLMNSKVYFIQGDTASYELVEPLVSQVPKAKDELRASKNWAIAGLVFAAAAVAGVTMTIACKSDDNQAIGASLMLTGYAMEILSGRQSNNHYNEAVSIYNKRIDGEFSR